MRGKREREIGKEKMIGGGREIGKIKRKERK